MVDVGCHRRNDAQTLYIGECGRKKGPQEALSSEPFYSSVGIPFGSTERVRPTLSFFQDSLAFHHSRSPTTIAIRQLLSCVDLGVATTS